MEVYARAMLGSHSQWPDEYATDFPCEPDCEDVLFVFGAEAHDDGSVFNSTDYGRPKFDADFDLLSPSSQLWLSQFMARARKLSMFAPRSAENSPFPTRAELARGFKDGKPETLKRMLKMDVLELARTTILPSTHEPLSFYPFAGGCGLFPLGTNVSDICPVTCLSVSGGCADDPDGLASVLGAPGNMSYCATVASLASQVCTRKIGDLQPNCSRTPGLEQLCAVNFSTICPHTCKKCPPYTDDPAKKLASDLGSSCAAEAGSSLTACGNDLSTRVPIQGDNFGRCLGNFMTGLYSTSSICDDSEDQCVLPIIWDTKTGKPKALALSLSSVMDGGAQGMWYDLHVLL